MAEQLLEARAMAAVLGLSQETFDALQAAGAFAPTRRPRGRAALYDLIPTVQATVRWYQGQDDCRTVSDMAAILGVSVRRVQQLTEEMDIPTYPKRKGNGRVYHLQEAVRRVYKAQSDRLQARDKAGAKLDREQVAAQHERIKMDISALKLRRLRGELVETTQVEGAVADMLTAFRSSLLALPARATPQVMGEPDSAKVLAVLERETLLTMEALHGYTPAPAQDEDDDAFGDALEA